MWGLGRPLLMQLKNLCMTSLGSRHMQIPQLTLDQCRFQLRGSVALRRSIELQGPIEKKPHISGRTQFKSMFFRDQLCIKNVLCHISSPVRLSNITDRFYFSVCS